MDNHLQTGNLVNFGHLVSSTSCDWCRIIAVSEALGHDGLKPGHFSVTVKKHLDLQNSLDCTMLLSAIHCHKLYLDMYCTWFWCECTVFILF